MFHRKNSLVLYFVVLQIVWLYAKNLHTDKFIGFDTKNGDMFGHSTAITADSTTAIIGASQHDTNNITNTGAAYIFELNETSNEWYQTHKLTPSDAHSHLYFGASVAIYQNNEENRTYAIIGASFCDHRDNGDSDQVGVAYIFEKRSNTWLQVAKFNENSQNATNGSFFGCRVSIYDNTAIVGAYSYNPNRTLQSDGAGPGAVFVYQRKQHMHDSDSNGNTSWSFDEIIMAYDGSDGDRFGGSVDIYNNACIIGAEYYSDDERTYAGAAYIYEKQTNWDLVVKINNTNGSGMDKFGQIVGIADDDLIVITSDSWDSEGLTDSGAVFVYEKGIFTNESGDDDDGGGIWTQTGIIKSSNMFMKHYFGEAITVFRYTDLISGLVSDYLMVAGFTTDDHNNCSMYMFQRYNYSEWIETNIINLGETCYYGYDISMTNTQAIIGSSLSNNQTGLAIAVSNFSLVMPTTTTTSTRNPTSDPTGTSTISSRIDSTIDSTSGPTGASTISSTISSRMTETVMVDDDVDSSGRREISINDNVFIAILVVTSTVALLLIVCMILLFIHCEKYKHKKSNNENMFVDINRMINKNKNKNKNKHRNVDVIMNDKTHGTSVDLQNNSSNKQAIVNINDQEQERQHEFASVESSVEILFNDLKHAAVAIVDSQDVNGEVDRLNSEDLYEISPQQSETVGTTAGTTCDTQLSQLMVQIADDNGYHEWTQKHVILWIKIILIQNKFENQAIVSFLREFAAQCINGKQLEKLKQDDNMFNQLVSNFSLPNREFAIWKVIQSAI